MSQSILVTYASKHGGTLGIATAIAEVLRQAGLEVDVQSVDLVQDPSKYAAVVLGSALYIGQWRKEAIEFLEVHAETLAKLPVFLFSSGPTGEGDPAELLKGVVIPDNIRPVIDRINPRQITVFHGELDPQELGLGERLIIKGVKAPTGDYRDWESIDKWATSIADALAPKVT